MDHRLFAISTVSRPCCIPLWKHQQLIKYFQEEVKAIVRLEKANLIKRHIEKTKNLSDAGTRPWLINCDASSKGTRDKNHSKNV